MTTDYHNGAPFCVTIERRAFLRNDYQNLGDGRAFAFLMRYQSGQYQLKLSDWHTVADSLGAPVEMLYRQWSDAQILRIRWAREVSAILAGDAGEHGAEFVRLAPASSCLRCGLPVATNAELREAPAGATDKMGNDISGMFSCYGPECWAAMEGGRARRRAERAAIVARAWSAPAAPAARAAPERCKGTCDLDAVCPDCD